MFTQKCFHIQSALASKVLRAPVPFSSLKVFSILAKKKKKTIHEDVTLYEPFIKIINLYTDQPNQMLQNIFELIHYLSTYIFNIYYHYKIKHCNYFK